MAHSTPPQPDDHARDALRGLEERLDRASAAAERLIAEAGGYAAARMTGRPPAAGWQAPEADRNGPSGGGAAGGAATADGRSELELLSQALRALRDLVPPELATRITEALRELLLAMRALIDWYVERLDRRRAEPDEVEDIPIR